MTQTPILPCMCGSFRRAARALTQLYEHEIRLPGLSSSQLTILQVFSRTGEITQGRLGEILAMDSTTLTRTLRIMLREGWLAESRGTDRRERHLRLSTRGETQLRRANPVWEKVQARLRRKIGAQQWANLLQFTAQITDMATRNSAAALNSAPKVHPARRKSQGVSARV